MTTPINLCQTGWKLYDEWDTACRDNVTHEPAPEDIEKENAAWIALLDHKAACKECWKDNA